MRNRLLADRVNDGVLAMREGEKTTVGKIAAVEGVSKSPQLYRVVRSLELEGYLRGEIVKHTNGHPMLQYTRTSKADPRQRLPFGSES